MFHSPDQVDILRERNEEEMLVQARRLVLDKLTCCRVLYEVRVGLEELDPRIRSPLLKEIRDAGWMCSEHGGTHGYWLISRRPSE